MKFRIISLGFLWGKTKKVDPVVTVSIKDTDMLTLIDVDCKYVAEYCPVRASGIKKIKDAYAAILCYTGEHEDVQLLESERVALMNMCNDYCIEIAMKFDEHNGYQQQFLENRYEFATNAYLSLA